MSLPRQLPAALACAALAAVLAGCGASGNGSGSSAAPTSAGAAASSALPAPTKDDALAAKVPQSVAADGKIVFGTDASYAPNEFIGPDGTTIVGMDVDLGTAVAQKLGLTAEFQNSAVPRHHPRHPGREVRARHVVVLDQPRARADRRHGQLLQRRHQRRRSSRATPTTSTRTTCAARPSPCRPARCRSTTSTARNQKCTAAGKPAIQVTELQAQTDVTLALTANGSTRCSPTRRSSTTPRRPPRGPSRPSARPTTPRRTASCSTRARPSSRRPSRAPCSR